LGVLRRRLARIAAVDEDADLEDALLAVHGAIAAAPSVLALASLEDAALDRRRPNLPGTSRLQRDNWCHALPLTLDQLERDPLVRRLATAMARD
jgi:4-alpha-glucanotransferase